MNAMKQALLKRELMRRRAEGSGGYPMRRAAGAEAAARRRRRNNNYKYSNPGSYQGRRKRDAEADPQYFAT